MRMHTCMMCSRTRTLRILTTRSRALSTRVVALRINAMCSLTRSEVRSLWRLRGVRRGVSQSEPRTAYKTWGKSVADQIPFFITLYCYTKGSRLTCGDVSCFQRQKIYLDRCLLRPCFQRFPAVAEVQQPVTRSNLEHRSLHLGRQLSSHQG